jgi:hypothetical protein
MERALQELRRVLKPGGRLVVGELLNDPHYIPFGSLRKRAQAAGLALGALVGGSLAITAILLWLIPLVAIGVLTAWPSPSPSP